MPRAVLFDWDNTLVDNWPTIHDALNATFAAMGHPAWTLAETRERSIDQLQRELLELSGALARFPAAVKAILEAASRMRRPVDTISAEDVERMTLSH